ncbi:hypothetical protein AKJ09_08561 [Labilithrix luteola]|uniref:Uncharacterized protein n=1 Tax=Labilithrix luteola TaxID=1391654 RepID=A0A0K1Q832_9BACT|nr:hypothetical protein [Labilithrix luteola]AKV01898.1 hypothetical protein AKJ09_08561 [Labilithrix luteola]
MNWSDFVTRRASSIGIAVLAGGAAACSGMTSPGSTLAGEVPESSPTMSSPSEYGARPISAESGADYFLRTAGAIPTQPGSPTRSSSR